MTQFNNAALIAEVLENVEALQDEFCDGDCSPRLAGMASENILWNLRELRYADAQSFRDIQTLIRQVGVIEHISRSLVNDQLVHFKNAFRQAMTSLAPALSTPVNTGTHYDGDCWVCNRCSQAIFESPSDPQVGECGCTGYSTGLEPALSI